MPVLSVIEFPITDSEPDGAGGQRWRRDGTWKWSGVAAYAAGRPLAWLDDDHADPLFARSRAKFDHERAANPTLLCHVDPRVGLQTTHLDQIRTWAAHLPTKAR